jgi:hypothetical protein
MSEEKRRITRWLLSEIIRSLDENGMLREYRREEVGGY